jgi:hypothetical protein
MREELEAAYESARVWSRGHDYAGHDPFDALNSRLFQSTPFKRSRIARLAWTQALKRSPVNLRRLALVPEERNSKGTALFALAALSRLRSTREANHLQEARELLDGLLAARVRSQSGNGAWGYNFDWQGRSFYAPRGTPTVVPTAFAVRALVEGATALDAPNYLEAARGACEFILRDLHRSGDGDEEVCFSYTPLDRTRVFNASLLAAEALAQVGALTGERELTSNALRAARYVVRRQREDGSWAYGADSYQTWSDNFHTAFVLTSLARILKIYDREPERRAVKDSSVENFSACGEEMRRAVVRGYEFWRERFFLADGWPKYYHSSAHPADAHSAGAAVVACVELADIETDALELARRVARWSLRELFDRRGFFYYQKRRLHTVRTPFMRWSQGWMMYGLARLLEAFSVQP